jgi:hypothetical protein
LRTFGLHEEESMISLQLMRVFSAGVVLALSVLAALIPANYLTEYGLGPRTIGYVLALAGLGLTIVVLIRPRRFTNSLFVKVLVAAVVVVPLLSIGAGRVTYSSFGVTVYGLIPIPLLDVRVAPSGAIWFRDKTHHISLSEIQPYLDSDADIILGIGWDGVVQVDNAILNLGRKNIHILVTPAAFQLFNRMRSEGKRPILIAHTTC